MFFVHITLEKFENGSFTLKTRQMFFVHVMLEEFENGSFTLRFRFQIFYYYALFTTLITLTVLKKLHHLKKEKNITNTSPK